MSDPSANDFLRAFDEADRRGQAFDAVVDDIDGFAAAMTSAPAALGAAMDRAAAAAGGAAIVPASAFASAACARDGHIVATDEAFAAWRIPRRDLAAAVRGAGSEAPRLSAIIDDLSGRPVALAIAAPPRCLAWPLGDTARVALIEGRADYAVLAVRSADAIDWAGLFGAWSFSGAETRLAAALVRGGDLRRAAAEVGVAYETARETIAAVMGKTGSPRQPGLVRQLARLAFGDLPSNDATWRTFADVYDLTARQARLAQLIAVGVTRVMAASALRISDQSAKADLKVVYERCGVDGGVTLARIVAELDALTRLAGATDVQIEARGVVAEPLRFIRRRRAPGRIAVEDHGPRAGIPVIVFHAPVNGRHLPRVLVDALQARDLRPISVERPGFGLTTPAAGDCVAEAIADLIDVLDTLGLSRVRLLGRSVAMPLAFAAAHPGRVERGVLLSALPPGVRMGGSFLATMGRLALDRPALIGVLARMAQRLSSESTIVRLTERAVAESPPDLAAFADPLNRADWIRASRQSSAGDGFAREFALHADGGVMPRGATAIDWTAMWGEGDPIAAGVVDPAALWRVALPRGRYIPIPGAGRFLHLTHPQSIAAALSA